MKIFDAKKNKIYDGHLIELDDPLFADLDMSVCSVTYKSDELRHMFSKEIYRLYSEKKQMQDQVALQDSKTILVAAGFENIERAVVDIISEKTTAIDIVNALSDEVLTVIGYGDIESGKQSAINMLDKLVRIGKRMHWVRLMKEAFKESLENNTKLVFIEFPVFN